MDSNVNMNDSDANSCPPIESSDHMTNLKRQLEASCYRTIYSQTAHMKEAISLERRDSMMKWASALSSAVTTSSILGTIIYDVQECAIISAIFSIITMVVASITKVIDYKALSQAHKDAASRLWDIKEGYVSTLVDFDTMCEDQIMKRRDELQRMVANVYETSPPTSDRSYAEAKKTLEKENGPRFDDDDLNRTLLYAIKDRNS